MPANCRLLLFVQEIDFIWSNHFNYTGNFIQSLSELTLDYIYGCTIDILHEMCSHFLMLNYIIETENIFWKK